MRISKVLTHCLMWRLIPRNIFFNSHTQVHVKWWRNFCFPLPGWSDITHSIICPKNIYKQLPNVFWVIACLKISQQRSRSYDILWRIVLKWLGNDTLIEFTPFYIYSNMAKINFIHCNAFLETKTKKKVLFFVPR